MTIVYPPVWDRTEPKDGRTGVTAVSIQVAGTGTTGSRRWAIDGQCQGSVPTHHVG